VFEVMKDGWGWLATTVLFAAQIAGLLTMIHAVRRVRTAQATTAWCVGLLTLPIVVVPLYWVFGRTRFFGYRELMRKALAEHRGPAEQYQRALKDVIDPQKRTLIPLHRIAAVVRENVTFGNYLEPLVNGKRKFEVLFREIAKAEKYILAQYYILEDDHIGEQFADALIAKAESGIKVYLLYDDIGCQLLPARYLKRLEQAGVLVSSFNMGEGWRHRLQINFRNHRKMVVVDGRVALTGGMNVGDEYVDGGNKFKKWRDTHLYVRGPAVQALQSTFAMDWFWARHQGLTELDWTSMGERVDAAKIEPENPQGQATVVSTGPADKFQRCTMMVCELAAIAQRRLWICSPYFVPNEAVAIALETAAARGVEVRILLPSRPDFVLVFLVGHYFEDTLGKVGVKIYRYDEGFMHQKCILVDDSIAGIGTTNLDNRSLHLNFELMVLSSDPEFVAAVESMLEQDFQDATQSTENALAEQPFLFQILVGSARLFAPVL
jgi:cardiolipin synthase